MKHNVGGFDRNARIAVGVILLIVGLVAPITMTWRVVSLVIAAVALVTAFVGYCPVNAIFGFNSCKLEDEHHTHGGAAS